MKITIQNNTDGTSRSRKVTVVIPHRRRDENLTRCLLSLTTQTRLPCAVVVVDYDAKDAHERRRQCLEELGVTQALELRFMYGGTADSFCLTQARNRGRREVHTDYMASLDADCAISAPALADAEGLLDQETVAMVGAPVLYCMEDGSSARPRWYGTYPSGGFQVFRVSEFDRIGGYNELLRDWGYEDRDFMDRLHAVDEARQIMMLTYPYFHHWHPQEVSYETLSTFESRNRELAQASFWDGTAWRLISESARS